MSVEQSSPKGMSVRTARTVEYSIIALCIVSLIMIFQPFSLSFFSIGAGLVVLGGLAFNLVPLCRPGRPLASIGRAALIVLITLLIVASLAISAAYLYGIYLQSA